MKYGYYHFKITVEDVQLKDTAFLFEQLSKVGKVDVEYVDPYGGTHFEGQGISPNNSRCGECSFFTCEDCNFGRQEYAARLQKESEDNGGKAENNK